MIYLRWVLIILLFYLIYRVLKGLIRPRPRSETQGVRSKPNNIRNNAYGNDLLVQDPHCGVYLPRSEAVANTVNGQTFYFCSEDCKEEFLKAQK
ncbi:MAG: YHS domain-containing protein [Deltaproteobacteria bacterium]|nr:YHS domain-containing protein [Deltaproteobacteria bacterium]MBW2084773.1 YHS domain-containing protein [Deltaproteobacteria bacterium]